VLRKVFLALSIISAIIMCIVVATIMPETVPHHYNIAGEADRWGSKWIYVLFGMIPFFISASYEIYRKRTNNKRGNQVIEDKLIPLISPFFIVIFWVTTPITGSESLNPRLGCLIITMIGALMMIITNYSGKIRQNPHLGIRIPWTLKDETVWKKTHRLGGFTGIIGGLCMVVFSLIGFFSENWYFGWCMIGLIIGLIGVGIIPTVYSYCIYKKFKSGK